ncbi:MAG: tol-pal system protein YbgF [Desulfovibrio sp.]|jgi:tol-pal system protein YbgF|nr:tol-pal system protein YbgF [Desulfovibrio sp.]
MRTLLRLLFFTGASLLVTACSTTEQRLNSLEGQIQHVQVLDLRLSNAEDRLNKVESDVLDARGMASSGKNGNRKSERGYAQAGLRSSKSASSVGTEPASSPQFATIVPASPSPSLSPPVSETRASSPGAIHHAPAGITRPFTEERSFSPPQKTGSGEYDKALALYYSGQYEKAQEQFSDFLSRHPSNSLAPNTVYWQGECLYARKKFDSAIILFKDLAAKYPKHSKAAAALLKAGFAYEKIGDMENARFYWQILIDDFPRSEPASIARKLLAQG